MTKRLNTIKGIILAEFYLNLLQILNYFISKNLIKVLIKHYTIA